MNLIVVESPTKAKTLSRFLGKDYVVEATMGHIMDLPKEKLSVDIENNFKPEYAILAKKKEVIDKLKIDGKKSKVIYLATDPDREGEAIAHHVRDVLINDKLKMVRHARHSEQSRGISNDRLKRIVFHEITKEAVEDAIKNPRKIDSNLVDAQIARRVLDRLVGYKLSPLLWKKIRRGLSAGRVQSVTVRLIVERELEIEKFIPLEFWEIKCKVRSKLSRDKKDEFLVGLIKLNDKKIEVKNEKAANNITGELRNSLYKVLDLVSREVSKSPYPPFTTSTMTQSGARLFGWSAKKTMSVAQKLYEEGLITYHRTDSVNLSKAAVERARNYIVKTFGKKYAPEEPRFYKVRSKLAQEAHEAIRPTDVSSKFKVQSAKFEKEGEMLYGLIWKRFLACQMSNCIFNETVIDVNAFCQDSDNNYLLRANGQVMKFDGWRKLIPLTKDEGQALPYVRKDELLNLLDVLSEQKFTQPPARYNEASLIKTLEKLGIGRPSTYAPIISTIQIRNYVEKDEGKFKPTSIGIAVNGFLIKNFSDIFDYSFTAEMENGLDDVAKGNLEWKKMMHDFYFPFEKKLVDVEKKSDRVKIEVEKLGKKCPKCSKGELVVRMGRFGKFVSCSRFPDCDYKEKYVEKLGMKCPQCKKGDVIVKTTRRGKKFYGCSEYPKCKWASWRKPELQADSSK